MTWFSPSEVDDASEFELLPDNDYLAEVSGLEHKPNSKGTGELVVATFEVKAADGSSRKLKNFFNIVHENKTAQRIGKGEFKKFLAALGVTEDLNSFEDAKKRTLYKLLTITVTSEPDNKGTLRNNIKGFKSKRAPEGAPVDQADDVEIPF